MGMFPKLSTCGCDGGFSPYSQTVISPGAESGSDIDYKVSITRSTSPDPSNFSIVDTYEEGDYVIAEVVYHDATNFEGRKILVFSHVTTEDILLLDTMDPHFCDSGEHIAPLARFEPTIEGRAAAMVLVKALAKQ